MEQPSRYDLLRKAAQRLEEVREAEKQGNARRAEARELLQRRGRRSANRKE